GHDEAGELGVRLLLLVDPLGLIGGVFLWHGSLLFERKYLMLAPFLERKGAQKNFKNVTNCRRNLYYLLKLLFFAPLFSLH
ncbi:MAG: hypothetical protein IJI85_04405, partial [Clostridia bacterium]|nr:hypothetical protein [Clostridia bacterium]